MFRLIIASLLLVGSLAHASVSVQVNGTSYTIPQNNEKGWGTAVTSWIQAMSSYTLQPVGGTFTLTADANFGSAFGLKAPYLKSTTGNTPSTAGVLRLSRTDAIGWRNNASGGNLTLTPDGSDNLVSTFRGFVLNSGLGLSGVKTADVASGTSDEIDITSGSGTAANANSGPAYFGSGAPNGSGNSGVVTIYSPNATSGTAGLVTVMGGSATGGTAGSVYLLAGTATGGTPGDVLLKPGSKTGPAYGKLYFQNVGEGTAGKALVSTDTFGGTAFGNLGVSGGGTGLATLTAHALQVGNGTGTVTQLGPNASTVLPLVSGGSSADPSFALLTVPGGGTGLATLTAHAIQLGNGASTPTQLAVGATGTILKGVSSADPAFTATPVLGSVGTTGTLGFSGTTSGVVTIQPASVAGTYNFNLPITAGAAGQVLVSQGGGSTAMTWQPAGGGNGVNFVSNPDAEVDTTGWITYQDAAQATPVDATGGAPTVTFTRSTSSPLTGSGSFLITKDAANRQGEGASYAITIDTASQAKVMQIDFDYLVGSGTFVAGSSSADSDIEVYIYDVTNSALIQPSTYKLFSASSTVPSHFTANFQSASNSTSYRVIFHTATTSASAYTLKLDTVSVSPSRYVYGTPITDWLAFTPTGGWSANTTYTGWYRRVGDSAEFMYKVALAGAPTSASLTLNLPTGLTIDTAKLPATPGNTELGFSYGQAAAHTFTGNVFYNGTTSLVVTFIQDSGTTASIMNIGTVTQIAPFTFANADFVYVKTGLIPIVGWSSTVQMSDSSPQSQVSVSSTTQTPTGTLNGSFNVTKFGTITKDTLGAYSASTGLYTVVVPGTYKVSGQVEITATYTAGQNSLVKIFKNGTGGTGISLGSYVAVNAVTTTQSIPFTGLVECVAGDTIGVYALSGGSSISYSGSVTGSTLAIERIAGATSIGATELVAVRYENTAGTSIANSGDVQVPFATKFYDTHSAFATPTFTAPVGGKYRISATVEFASSVYAASNVAYLAVYKNGAASTYGPIFMVGGTPTNILGVSVTTTLQLVAGDTIDIRASNNRTAGATLLNTVAGDNHLEIERIGL